MGVVRSCVFIGHKICINNFTVCVNQLHIISITIHFVILSFRLLFPGQLLSSHFWSIQQKEQFFSREMQRRRVNLKKLNEYLSKSDKDLDKKILNIMRQISDKVNI